MSFYKNEVCGVYKISFGNDIYIGGSKQLRCRLAKHKQDLKNRVHPNSLLQNRYNAIGRYNVDILEYCTTDELNKTEQYYIDSYKPNLNKRWRVASQLRKYKNITDN